MAAIALMVLALMLRRRAPFAAPATTWMLAAALSFLDGRLIAGSGPVSVAGMIAAVLLGNLPDTRQARAGLVVVAASATVVVYNDPTHSVDDFLLIPVLFSIGWLVGFALHERARGGPGRRAASRSGRTGPRGRRPGRRGRGTRPDRPGAARRGGPRGQRHGPAGRRGAAPDARGAAPKTATR